VQIDYLSLDIEPAHQTLAALNLLPLDDYRFSVITYEHDYYREGPECMSLSRALLSSYGYQLVCENVQINGDAFEDWYVDPSVVSESRWRRFVSRETNHAALFNRSEEIE